MKHRRAHADPPAATSRVRRELDDLGRHPNKRLGQHFLADPMVARRIVELAGLDGGQRVVEIGPGLGALTDALCEGAGELWLIEVDADLAARLSERYAATPKVHVVHADALRVDFGEFRATSGPLVAVGNLPYNVGTAILRRLLDAGVFARLVLMLQREVAERLRAEPGSEHYGALSVYTQFAARVRAGVRVDPAAFVPRPKVESEVVVLEPYVRPPVDVRDRAQFARVVRAAFGQRRKQLGNSLKTLGGDPAAALRAAGIDARRRPETLSLAEFAALGNVLS